VALKALAERHDWKLRTLYHDIDALSLAGYQIHNEEGRYRLEEPGPAMPGTPTADERLALYLARQQASAWKHTSLGKALDRLWHRLSSAAGGQAALLPIESVSWITARTWTAIDYDRHKRLVATLERALRDGCPIQARYRAISTGGD
jgi:predicted DNA-binding transcriptional regulator YafY